MKIRNANNNMEVNVNAQEVYNMLEYGSALTNHSASNSDSAREIIAWLPSIKQIDVVDGSGLSLVAPCLHIRFLSGDVIVMEDTGLEEAFANLIRSC